MLFRRRRVYSARKKRERKRSFLIRFSIALIILVILTGGLAWFSHWDKIIVKHVSIKGASSISSEELQEFIASRLSGSYALLFPRSNFFLYPRNVIREELLNAYPRILSLNYAHDDFQNISVYLEERTPYAFWCGDSFEELSLDRGGEEGTCYEVDHEGAIYASAVFKESSNIFLKLYGPVSEMKIRVNGMTQGVIGYYFLPQDFFKRIFSFRDIIQSTGLVPRALIKKGGGDYEFVFENNSRLLFNEQDDFLLLASNLEAVFEAESLSKEDFTDPRSSLQYLDLRFGNRVYYKKN